MSKFDTVLIKGELTDNSATPFDIVEQGTVDNCGYLVGEIYQRYGCQFVVTEILLYDK